MLHSAPTKPSRRHDLLRCISFPLADGLLYSTLVATKLLWHFLCLQELSGPGQVSLGFLIRRNAICHSQINEDELRAPVESTL